jgi:hypothetical protein
MGSGWRSQPMPRGWERMRRECKQRAGGRCEAVNREGERCIEAGNEAHHAGGPDEHDNLVWLCRWHHQRITAWQASAGKKKITVSRPAERHPGLR